MFGRRGSGKTSLLRKAIAEQNLDRRPSAFVDLEPFKGHTYPDVLISVLIEFFRSLQAWLDEAAVARKNENKVWRRWFSKPRKPPLKRKEAAEISAEVDTVLQGLEELLHSQDDAEIERHSQLASKEASHVDASISAPVGPSIGASAGISGEETRTEDMLEKLRRSKANYLRFWMTSITFAALINP